MNVSNLPILTLTFYLKITAGEIRKNRKKGGPAAGTVEDSSMMESGSTSSITMKGPKTTKSSIKANESRDTMQTGYGDSVTQDSIMM